MGGGLSKHQDDISKPVTPVVVSSSSSAASTKTTTAQTKEELPTSKCPMHNADGSYSYDWKQLFCAAKVHGPGGSKELSKEQQEEATRQAGMKVQETGGGGCPVKQSSPPQSSSSSSGGGCPVKQNSSHPEYNVYSQPIDKTNQMPKGIRTQMPVAVQTKELSTNRVSSSIPKGGGDVESSSSTWTYPSPQQFYNSLARKGKLDEETSEDDMESVVALHNNMNEKTWAQVVEWEQQTSGSKNTPKLLKFQGRPHDLSPKAMLKHYLLGHPLPFDRHDWTVLREDGSTVRYVIDYYYDESRAQLNEESAKPSLHDRNATPSLLVDVRPALDGPTQLVARVFQMPYSQATNQTTFEYLPLKGTPEMSNQVQESVQVWQSIQKLKDEEQQQQQDDDPHNNMKISPREAKEIAMNFSHILKQCHTQQVRVDRCDSDKECAEASMDLIMCMGTFLCPVQHKSLIQLVSSTAAADGGSNNNNQEEEEEAKIEVALETLTECVAFNAAKRKLAKEQHPEAFSSK